MKHLRGKLPIGRLGLGLGLLAVTVGCAGHLGRTRTTNIDLTVISFGAVNGETSECG